MHWRASTKPRYAAEALPDYPVSANNTKATAYDSTRRHLLRGREDMLGLVGAQLNFKADSKELKRGKAIWVDVCCP